MPVPDRACEDSWAPIMMFGGSPICVAAPPMFENITSAIMSGTGSKSRTLAICMVTGTMRRIVVTLSRKAENTAVIVHSMTERRHMEPPLRA